MAAAWMAAACESEEGNVGWREKYRGGIWREKAAYITEQRQWHIIA